VVDPFPSCPEEFLPQQLRPPVVRSTQAKLALAIVETAEAPVVRPET
jgi:hypothetical protein